MDELLMERHFLNQERLKAILQEDSVKEPFLDYFRKKSGMSKFCRLSMMYAMEIRTTPGMFLGKSSGIFCAFCMQKSRAALFMRWKDSCLS